MTAPQNSLTSTSSSIKFLCSYGGKILPRPSDGRLRYTGGLTRVLAVHRSISFSGLMMKLNELCGYSVNLRCQLPNEDLDVLVSIKSDEDLSNVIEEYDKASSLAGKEMKIRAILSPPKSSVSSSTVTSPSSSSSGAYPSHSSFDRIRTSTKQINPSLLGRKPQYGVVRDRCFYYYPCHLQAHYRPSSYFSQHSNNHWQ